LLLKICSVLAIVWDHSTVYSLYNSTKRGTLLQFINSYYFYFPCRYNDATTLDMVLAVLYPRQSHTGFSFCYTMFIFCWLHVRPNVGSVVLAQVLLLTFLIFSNIAPLFNVHLLSTYKAWNTCDIAILYHILCL